MTFKKRVTVAAVFLAVVIGLRIWLSSEFSLQHLIEHRDEFRRYAQENYFLSVAVYCASYLASAFFLPGALPLAIIGGFLFGWAGAFICIVFSALAGSSLSFYAARRFLGRWIQTRYSKRLKKFNAEMDLNGPYYLIAMRILPVFPFFMVNFFAGLTRMPFRIYLLATLFGIVPGAIIYPLAGERLGAVRSGRELLSGRVVLPVALMLFLVVFPIILNEIRRKKRKPGKKG